MSAQSRELAVRVAVVKDPALKLGVLLQLPDGYVVLSLSDATRVAAALLDAGDELEAMQRGS
jgi:hypothetical protein